MPDRAGTGAAGERHQLEALVDRCANDRAEFRATAGATIWEQAAALTERRAVEVGQALAGAGGALDWLSREMGVYLAGCSGAPNGALRLGVALGVDAGTAVQAMIGPALVFGSLRLEDDVVYGHRPSEAATDLAAFLGRHFDEPEARSLGALAAAAIGLRGLSLVDKRGRELAAEAVRLMALAVEAQEPGGELGARRDAAVTLSWCRLLYEPLLHAAGWADDESLAQFVEQAWVLESMAEAARAAADDPAGRDAADAAPAAGGASDVPLSRLLELDELGARLTPDLVRWAGARVGDLAVEWLQAIDRRRQIEAWLSGAGTSGPAVLTGPARSDGTTGKPLTVLMFGYCFNRPGRQRLIGVYKRVVRIGMELVARGHQVYLSVSGGNDYSDPLIELARRTPGLFFVDLDGPSRDARNADGGLAVHRDYIREVQPDVALVGDVPLAGVILQATIAATQCGVPMVVAENLYAPKVVTDRLLAQGAYADGLLLVGPSSHELRPAPPIVYYAPPFAPARQELDAVAIDQLLDREPEIVVLGYDPKVAQLGLQLARSLGPIHEPVVVITPDAESVRSFADSISLPQAAVTTLPPVTENQLFALLRAARLAVVKAGFMQITECLALGTPVVALRFRDFEIGWLPERSQRLVVSSRDITPTPAVVNGARRLLAGLPDAGRVHDGPLDGTSAAADCVEKVAALGLRSTTADAARLGVDPEIVVRALRKWWSPETLQLTMLRCNSIRELGSLEVFAAVAHTRCNGEGRAPALAIWLFDTAMGARHQWDEFSDERRRTGYQEGRLIVEQWVVESALPHAEWHVS